jgi:malonyl-CoA O-methyltransferase
MHELDQQQLRRACDRAAAGYDAGDVVAATIRARLLERFELFTLQPQCILDLGCGTGAAAEELQRRYPDALIINLDWSEAMLRQARGRVAATLCADSHQLPLADASVDIVVSNMMLPGCRDPEGVFAEARRVLRNPGLLLFTTLGPDSLSELRRAWATVDPHSHVQVFPDMHNVGDALAKAGFREPVMDVEMLTVNYTAIRTLVDDLRAVAATNFSRNRLRGLTTPRRWQQLVTAMDTGRNPAGKLPVSVEIVTGQAWTGAPDIGVSMENGVASFPADRIGSRIS